MLGKFFFDQTMNYLNTFSQVHSGPTNITVVKCLGPEFERDRIYALASKEAYNTVHAKQELYDAHENVYYRLDNTFGMHDALVYHSPNKVIIAYRGTIPTQINDLITDLRIFQGTEKNSSRVQDALGLYDRVDKKYNARIVVTGHSLGGNVAINTAIEKRCFCVSFNAGSGGNREFLNIQNDVSLRNLYKHSIKQYYIHGDIIPANLVGVGRVILINKDLDTRFPHSIDYYLNDSLACDIGEGPQGEEGHVIC